MEENTRENKMGTMPIGTPVSILADTFGADGWLRTDSGTMPSLTISPWVGLRPTTPAWSAGQMIEDIKLAVECKVKVEHYGRFGGIIHSPEEVLQALENQIIGG